ncbi:phosphate ABC transporter permease subunit PstC [Couchioplanes caeruleus]|uniref:Phosphate transport system permease protein n=2 Tax=Couchioplanes caeruleus TaxID=56438 RepID=A0A1K0GCU8_9ACTN|nr:phosphate ABC transporter permease subunit PstC [Couchioplanes caeruleus]OJF09998.1 phosphate ABC transporter permease subunit PstC [Couchioplanes caeruleus subsp. caeruleus]ROP31668.1 phosphate ABC transporter membrane protein 1 (PhoT family) [Couchioplanes caeruleus]
MGDYPSRSADSSAGVSGVTHTRYAGNGVSPIPPNDRPPLGGGGGLPTKARFSMESGFRGISTAAGAMVLVIIVAIAIFLVSKAVPALSANTENFLTYKAWFPNETAPRFGIAALAFGTLLSSVIALIVAVPIALGIALFLSHYAPKRLATPLGFTIDLLAAVPSVVFGLWGRDVFSQPVEDLSVWLNKYFGWLPIFGGDGPFGRSILLGGLVLAIMVLPIVTSLSREVFQQTPGMNEEAALALGATKWEMIRTAVLPYGKPGVIAAVMLGLGRALGETIALALTLGTTFTISFNLIESGGNSIAANIANTFGEATGTGRGALIASGLILFAITLVVNMAARAIIYRRREFRDSAA